MQLTRTVGRVQPFISGSYRSLGNTSTYRLRDGFSASAGASLPIGRTITALVSYHYAAAASRFVRDGHELFAGASAPILSRRFRLSGYVTKGLSNGAADASGGVSIGMNL